MLDEPHEGEEFAAFDFSAPPRCLLWFASTFRGCSGIFPALQSLKVKTSTETLQVGSRAPEFSLLAANDQDSFSLSDLLKRGPVILEFLRGTW